jgi:hypothetical protein
VWSFKNFTEGNTRKIHLFLSMWRHKNQDFNFFVRPADNPTKARTCISRRFGVINIFVETANFKKPAMRATSTTRVACSTTNLARGQNFRDTDLKLQGATLNTSRWKVRLKFFYYSKVKAHKQQAPVVNCNPDPWTMWGFYVTVTYFNSVSLLTSFWLDTWLCQHACL